MILNSKIYGNSGKHLLIFHGLFGMSDNWHSFAQKFQDLYTVHTIDLRNHGKSFHSEVMNLKEMAKDISNYIEYHKIENYYLLGHSLGGKVVMEYSLLNKTNLPEKIIVVDIAPKVYNPHHQGIIKALLSIDFSKIQTRKQVEQALLEYIKDLSVIQFLLKNLYWTENKTLNFRFNIKSISQNYELLISRANSQGNFKNPTLFISGQKSDYITKQDNLIIKELFSNYEIVQIKDSGHWVHADNPDDFFIVVKEFL